MKKPTKKATCWGFGGLIRFTSVALPRGLAIWICSLPLGVFFRAWRHLRALSQRRGLEKKSKKDGKFGQEKAAPELRSRHLGAGSTIISTFDKIKAKDYQVSSPLVIQGFSNFLGLFQVMGWQTSWWWFQSFFWFSKPNLWEMESNLTCAYFSTQISKKDSFISSRKMTQDDKFYEVFFCWLPENI